MIDLIDLKTTPKWLYFANCRETSTDVFFPENDIDRLKAAQAKVICSQCLVRKDCLEFALEHDEQHGIWGGLTPKDRNLLDRRPKR